jgi:hypothetical protein
MRAATTGPIFFTQSSCGLMTRSRAGGMSLERGRRMNRFPVVNLETGIISDGTLSQV